MSENHIKMKPKDTYSSKLRTIQSSGSATQLIKSKNLFRLTP